MQDQAGLPIDPADLTEMPFRQPSVTFLLPGDVNSRSIQSHSSTEMSKSMASGYVSVSAVIKSRQTSVQPLDEPAPASDDVHVPIPHVVKDDLVSFLSWSCGMVFMFTGLIGGSFISPQDA